VAAGLGIGMSTLNNWIAQHKHNDLMSGPHDDVHKELPRLRKEDRTFNYLDVQSFQRQSKWFSCFTTSFNVAQATCRHNFVSLHPQHSSKGITHLMVENA